MDKHQIITVTTPYDIHAMAVVIATEAYGFTNTIWYPSSFPSRSLINLCITASNATSCVDHMDSSPGRHVLWNRRRGLSNVGDVLHPEDLELSRQFSEVLIDATLYHLAATAKLAINPPSATRFIERSKFAQLKAAADAGIRVPDTLISNDPERIRAFISSHTPTPGIVFKGLLPLVWRAPSSVHIGYTASVTQNDLPPNDQIRNSPGIYQVLVHKISDIRVTIMGEHVVAVELGQRGSAAKNIDWRASNTIEVAPIQLPEETKERLLAVNAALGACFSCIDLALSSEGDYVFLECNQMGQFLWIEEIDPEIQLLDAFAQFLISGDAQYRGPEGRTKVKYGDVVADAMDRLARDAKTFGFKSSG